MTEVIANWLFDLGGLIGALITAWPLILVNRDSVRRNTSVLGLSARDREELIPQIKWSQTGALILVLTVVGKLMYLMFVHYGLVNCSPSIIVFLIMGTIALITIFLRICLINRYWAKYKF